MGAIISLLIIISISILITRIATIALSNTGLSRESARFQARSAFTGVGFTTSESEKVVNHPVRRKILLLLMLLGNAGVVTAISSLILSFISPSDSTGITLQIILLITGISILLFLANSSFVDYHLSRFITHILKHYTKLDVRDYAHLLNLAKGYRISTLRINKGDWLEDKSLRDLQLRKEGLNVLGIHRENGDFLGVPEGKTILWKGDTIVLYGREDCVSKLEKRRKGSQGDWAHNRAVDLQRKEVEQEQMQENRQNVGKK